ncbi:DUF3149 domain-containing protein [Vibrio chagasii]|nr:DUF3149 domain-containing protein [Vibrio chagasii]
MNLLFGNGGTAIFNDSNLLGALGLMMFMEGFFIYKVMTDKSPH